VSSLFLCPILASRRGGWNRQTLAHEPPPHHKNGQNKAFFEAETPEISAWRVRFRPFARTIKHLEDTKQYLFLC
jgi:hypothetical protein